MAVVLLVPFVLQIRRQPVAWTVLVALMILPSFALGVVGLARYAVQCFPLSIAAGGWLSQLNPRVGRLAVVAAAASIVVWGVLITRASYVP